MQPGIAQEIVRRSNADDDRDLIIQDSLDVHLAPFVKPFTLLLSY